MSRSRRYLRAFVSLLVIGALAALLSLGLRMALEAVGIGPAQAGPIGIATAVAVALAIADVYTPIGRGPQRADIRSKDPAALGTDFLLTGVLTLVVSVALVLAGDAVWAPLGGLLVVFVVGVGAGYGWFMMRNREFYFTERGGDVAE